MIPQIGIDWWIDPLISIVNYKTCVQDQLVLYGTLWYTGVANDFHKVNEISTRSLNV